MKWVPLKKLLIAGVVGFLLPAHQGAGQTGNAVSNGGFESGTTGWSFYSDGSATFASVSPGYTGTKAGRATITTPGTNVQLYQYNIALDPDTDYRLSFKAYSNTSHDFSVSLTKHTTPYTSYGLSGVVANLTGAWQTFTMNFRTTGFSTPVADARLRFWFAPYDAAGDIYYIDDIILEKTAVAPVITTPPAALTVVEGDPAAFTVVASGTIPLAYQWQRDTVNIPGATAAAYMIPATAASDHGAVFRCVVTNASGSVTSPGAALTVIPATSAPIITLQPTQRSVLTGQTALFTVAAIGPSPLGYQWQRNSVDIAGANSASYTTPPAQLADSGASFRCVVSNLNGGTPSSGALLLVDSLVGDPPVITQQPLGRTVSVGQTATFTVVSGGTAPLAYQWQKDGSNIGGATNAGYTTPATTIGDNGSVYRCLVSNLFGSATSDGAVLFVVAPPPAATLLSPQPGDIYKEFSRTMGGDKDWRVTNPSATNAGSNAYKPNPILAIDVADTVGAIRAELVIDKFGGHIGTSTKRFRFNSNAWITVPELASGNGIPSGHTGQCYEQQLNPVIPIPLTHLRQGANTLEGTSGGQTCYNFNWGQWGWYGVIVRVYYGPQKGGPRGSIASPSENGVITDNPLVAAAIQSGGPVSRIEFFASYEGFDPDGDGVYGGYQHSYHRLLADAQLTTRYHVGTSFAFPYQVSWNTSLVPDQPAGTISMVARIRDANGLWYVTPEVRGLTLQRDSFSVKLYKPANVPENWRVRSGQPSLISNFTIPVADSFPRALSSTLIVRTWNGTDGASEPTESHSLAVNGWTAPNTAYGQDNFYSIDFLDVPVTALTTGTNSVTVSSNTIHHGIDVLWPGPMMMVRYSKFPPTPVSITQQPIAQSVSEGQTATFSVSATGTPPLVYQWQRNGSTISGATGSSHTTPPLAFADSGASYRCVVSNLSSSATSASAVVSVTPAPLTIQQQPLSQTVKTGSKAVFSVTVVGSEPMTYQWSRTGSPIAGATSAWYVTPATVSGDNGSTYTCSITNPVGTVTSQAAVLSLLSTTPPSLLASDDFNALTLHPRWVFINPAPPSILSLTGPGTADARVQLDIPGGVAHDLIPSALSAPRLLQAVNNTNFEVELKFESTMDAQYQRQGIIVEENDRNYMLFDFERRSTYYRVRAIKVVNNVSTSQYAFSVPGATILYMKVKRTTNTWVHSTSLNGTSWTQRGYFTHAINVGRVGPWFGTAGSPAPAFSGKLDYFFNTASRISPEDGAVLPPAITGEPAAQTVAYGLQATFSVTAVGTQPLSYQWRRNGAAVPGATAATYSTAPVTPADSGAAYSCVVTNGLGSATSADALLHTIPDPSGIHSEDFNTFGLNPAVWTMVDPLGDGIAALTGTNTPDARLSVTIPAGQAHDAWTAGNQSYRVLQPTNNTDFWLEAKFESPMTAAYQLQGILVEQDSVNYLRFDFLRGSTGVSIYSASFLNGVPTQRISSAITAGVPFYMRVKRAVNQWTLSTSADGSLWTTAGTFTHALTARRVGPFFGTSGAPAPAFTGLIDYFFLTNEPVTPEDGGVAVDSFPPVISNITVFPRVDGFMVSWITDEPATGNVAYGLTASHELGSMSHADFRTDHSLIVTGLNPGTPYRFRIASTDGAGNADSTASTPVITVTPTPPVFSIWYGKTQQFGNLGNPTPYINILGDVVDANGIMALSYSVNGAPPVTLSIGPDTQRLNKAGDFNADILTSALMPGANQVVITAIDSQATAKRETVMVNYTAGVSWAKSYTIDWRQSANIQDLVQVVDGKWTVADSVVRTVETGYDRLLAIGELDWVNYEATMKVVVHSLDPTGFQAPSNRPGIGFILRWPGHSDLPVAVAGRQPKTGYLPLGAFGIHRWYATGEQDITIYGDALRTVALDNTDRTLVLGVPYRIKMRGQSVAGLGTDYSFKIWLDGTPEPSAWDISGREPLSGPQSGCLLLVAHEVDVSIGEVTVVPLDVPSTIVSDDFNTGTLNTALWTFVNPRGDASVQIQGPGTGDPKVAITVPAGLKHEPWTPANTAPRILQPANNTNFTVQAKFDSPLTADVQIHGIIVEQDSVNFVRFDFSTAGSQTRIFSGTAAGGSFVGRYNQTINGTPPYMRVRRLGSQWTLFHSFDGTSWVQTAAFSHALNVVSAGLYGGNAGTGLPGYTMVADYFFNQEQPITPEDGSPGGLPARILLDPVSTTVASADTARFFTSVNGTPPIAFRWQRDGSDIPGAVGSSLTIGPVTVGSDNGARFRCIVSNTAGSDTSAEAILTVAYPPAVLVSDDFRSGILNPTIWTFRNPLNDAAVGITGAGTQDARLNIQVPAGTSHDLWTSGNMAPKVLQDANNTNFDLEARFDSPISSVYQLQGIVVQENPSNFIRCDFVTHGTLNYTRVFCATFVNGTPTTRINVNTVARGVAPLWMRIGRLGDTWTVQYSTNGTTFTTAGSFSHVLSVDSVGVYAGNAGTTPPAFTALVDYFFNLASPLAEEDPVPPTIVTQPSPATVTEGRRAVFSVVATGSAPLSYQWKKNGINILGATGSTLISQPVTLDDNGSQVHCVVSNPSGSVNSGSATLTVNAAIVLPWWDAAWSFRLPVIVNPNSYERVNRPVELAVNFSAALAMLGATGKQLDTASLRVIEVNSVHAILDTLVPAQFDRDADFHPSTKASGTLIFLVEGNTPASMTRYFDVYFDTTGKGPFTPPVFAPQVAVFDTAAYQGQASFKIITTSGTYFYHKDGGGFASFIDPTGADWIAYQPGGGASGAYRGIPNTGATFHPGYTNASSVLERQGPLRSRIRSFTSGNAWESVWDIFPGYARMTMTRMDGTYWWLYEGTPGGSFQLDRDYYRRPNGIRTSWRTKTQGDLSGQEWAYFGDTTGSRILFVAHHEDDTKPELFRHEDSAMTVFGFGRQDPCCNRFIDLVPQTFTFGFGEDSSFAGASRTIYSAYKDVAITTEEPQYQGSTGVPLLSTIISDNFNDPSLNSDLWTYSNPLGDTPLGMTGTQLQMSLPSGAAHDVWTDGINSPRVMQPANNANFEVEAKFSSVTSGEFQIQGVLVQEDANTVLRFDFVRGLTGLSAFAARVDAGVTTTYIGTPIATLTPIYLRVKRVGNTWTHSSSPNGTTWTVSGSFTDDLAVSSVGVFFGNAGTPTPAFNGLVDYFMNLDAPVAPIAAQKAGDVAKPTSAVPEDYVVYQNYPNPFNPATSIQYGLPEPATVTLTLYNVLGQEIATLVDAGQEAGYHSVVWRGVNNDGSAVGSGVYLYRIAAKGTSGRNYAQLKKMILMR